MSRSVSRAATLVACGLLATLTACGRPTPEPSPPLNTLGTNINIRNIELRNVYVVGARDGNYLPGEQARVRLTLLNDGRRTDALTKVTSEVASAVSLHWDRACDGRAESVRRIVIQAGGPVPQNPATTATATSNRAGDQRKDYLHQPYYIQLTVDEEILNGTTVPITFTFEHAGTLTVDVMVQSRHRLDQQTEFACLSEAVPSPSAPITE